MIFTQIPYQRIFTQVPHQLIFFMSRTNWSLLRSHSNCFTQLPYTNWFFAVDLDTGATTTDRIHFLHQQVPRHSDLYSGAVQPDLLRCRTNWSFGVLIGSSSADWWWCVVCVVSALPLTHNVDEWRDSVSHCHNYTLIMFRHDTHRGASTLTFYTLYLHTRIQHCKYCKFFDNIYGTGCVYEKSATFSIVDSSLNVVFCMMRYRPRLMHDLWRN